ncbi:MAG: hypothetical protein ACREFO_13315 [Acetobacteraceae bacterium]
MPVVQDGEARPLARPHWQSAPDDWPQPFGSRRPPRGRVPPLAAADAEPLRLFSTEPDAPDASARRGGFAEQLLLDAAHRAVRASESRIAVVLHLARLAPPGPQPHHRRIARALLTEAAQRHDGQLFPLGNGDLVLLCRSAATHTHSPDDPGALPDTLKRLFARESPDPGAMVSLWPLAEEADRLLTYARERTDTGALRSPAEPPRAALPETLPPPALQKHALQVLPPAVPELLQRRTAALISRTDGVRPRAIQPLFRDISFSPAALEACYAPLDTGPADPWLCRHLTHRSDEQLLALLGAALPGTGPLGMAGVPVGLAFHLSISPQVILRPRFDHFANLCRTIGVNVGIEVPLVAAVAAPTAFTAARTVLHRSGFQIVLGGISYQALRLIRPQALEVDLLKLDWTPKLARLAEADQRELAASLAAIGPERVVLRCADTEAALVWGLGQGIRRFLGHHVDAMLAARRMLACPAASACTLHQCAERAISATAPGRRFCRNLSLLDAGAPTSQPPSSAPS